MEKSIFLRLSLILKIFTHFIHFSYLGLNLSQILQAGWSEIVGETLVLGLYLGLWRIYCLNSAPIVARCIPHQASFNSF